MVLKASSNREVLVLHSEDVEIIVGSKFRKTRSLLNNLVKKRTLEKRRDAMNKKM